MTKLNSNVDDERNVIAGQGNIKNIGLAPRMITLSKAKTPDIKKSKHSSNSIGLYRENINPSIIQTSRVIVQLEKSNISYPISSQLNNKINPVMNNSYIKGGKRITL
jgi:hypothetical protein